MLVQHLEKLRIFHAVACDLSMLKASVRLRISQPAVSQSIRRLESVLNQDLFRRVPGALSLTQAGEKLLVFTQKLLLSIDDLEQSLAHIEATSGVLRIGTYETLGEIIWPGALARLARKHPHLLIQLETGDALSLWSRLKNGEVDMMVDAEPDPLPAFSSKVVMKDVFQVFQSPQKSRQPPIAPPRFAYVEAAYDRRKRSIRDHLDERKIQHQLMYSVQSFPFARALALTGTCLAVLPARLGAKDVNQGRLVPYLVGGEPVIFGEHRICATFGEHLRNNPKVKAVIEALTQPRSSPL